MRWPTAVDLFAGAGGLSSGLRAARFRVVGAVEVDSLAAESYSQNFPMVKLANRDIRNVDPGEMLNDLGLEPGELGLLAGCPPCQGFSTIRTRRGRTVRDPRNGLVMEFARFAEVMRPQTLMMENVPGLADYRLFRSTLARLRKIGYQVTWEVRDAADFEVPQRRKRLILLGSVSGIPSMPPPSGRSVSVRDAISMLAPAGSSGDPLHDVVERRSQRVRSLISRIPKDGGSRSALGDEQLDCHQRTSGFFDVYGRMAWDGPSPTITGGCVSPSKGRFLHPEEDRTITLREALLLQGFPSDFRLSLRRGKYSAAEMVGNAIPPPLVAAHATALRQMATTSVGSYE